MYSNYFSVSDWLTFHVIFHKRGNAEQNCKIYANCPMMENLWINNIEWSPHRVSKTDI